MKKKAQELPKRTARNKKSISIVKVTKRNGKPISKELLYYWDDTSVSTFRMAIGFFRGFMAGWQEFSNSKTNPNYIEYPSNMEKDGYLFHNHRYYDFHGDNGEDIGSGICYRLERKSGILVTGKDAWPEAYKKSE